MQSLLLTLFEFPFSFGSADALELAVGVLLAALLFAAPWAERFARRLAARPRASFAILAALPILLRLALLPHHPIPHPSIRDDFGHLLMADTLLHARFANPPHRWHDFFETTFVLQQPTYSSIYPLGQGCVLALGRLFFHTPWAGVLLESGALAALCYWMLRAWTSPLAALAGGVLAVFTLGPLNEWTNTYSGGALSAIAGCLVFGSLPRLEGERPKLHALLLGAGVALQMLTRPYECVLMVVALALYFVPVLRRPSHVRKLIPLTGLAISAALPALLLTALQNRAVTGSFTTLPYALSQYQYGVPAALTFQSNPLPHRLLTPQQQLEYKSQRAFHGDAPDTIKNFLLRLEYRVRFYRFYFFVPLYFAIAAFVWTARSFRRAYVLAACAVFALGVNFFPYFYPRYVAAVACFFVLVSVAGLRSLNSLVIRNQPVGRRAAIFLLALCAAQFLFWYALHVFDDQEVSIALKQYESWDAINHLDSGERESIERQLAQTPGPKLIFVSYWPNHLFQHEWVYNSADIDASQVVWARDLGALRNQDLIRYYPNRGVWLVEPDAQPPRLARYPRPSPPSVPWPFQDVP
ncbi:MAG: hypothetical protein JO340_16560 [Acidobacteriaceae bacterium]|nr:hypothetical protein [Acidobacteriaceae bacterium]